MIQSELVADLSKSTGAATQPKAEKLVSIGATIVAYGSDDPMMYKVNLNTKNVETKAHAGVPHLLGANTPKEEDQIIFFDRHANHCELNPESGIVSFKRYFFPPKPKPRSKMHLSTTSASIPWIQPPIRSTNTTRRKPAMTKERPG